MLTIDELNKRLERDKQLYERMGEEYIDLQRQRRAVYQRIKRYEDTLNALREMENDLQ
jgi:hypothetical protein